MTESQQAELRQAIRLKYGSLVTDDGTWELIQFAYMAGLAALPRLYQIGTSTTDGFIWWDVPKDTYQQRKATGYVRVRVVALVQAEDQVIAAKQQGESSAN